MILIVDVISGSALKPAEVANKQQNRRRILFAWMTTGRHIDA
jgi:hypothetical protein